MGFDRLRRLSRCGRCDGCNCRVGKDTCSLNGKCQTESLVYKAIVTSPDNTTAEYIGQASTSFKARFNNHTSSFRNQQYSKNTALSSHFWNVKNTSRRLLIGQLFPLPQLTKPRLAVVNFACLKKHLSSIQGGPL